LLAEIESTTKSDHITLTGVQADVTLQTPGTLQRPRHYWTAWTPGDREALPGLFDR